MAEDEYPGVYVEETSFRSQPVEGVPTASNPWWNRGILAAAAAAIALCRRCRAQRKR